MTNPHGVATPEWMAGQGWVPAPEALIDPTLMAMQRGEIVAWRVTPNSYQWFFGIDNVTTLHRIPGVIATNRGGVEWILTMLMHMRYRIA